MVIFMCTRNAMDRNRARSNPESDLGTGDPRTVRLFLEANRIHGEPGETCRGCYVSVAIDPEGNLRRPRNEELSG